MHPILIFILVIMMVATWWGTTGKVLDTSNKIIEVNVTKSSLKGTFEVEVAK